MKSLQTSIQSSLLNAPLSSPLVTLTLTPPLSLSLSPLPSPPPLSLTRSSLSSEKVSTMIPKTTFSPIVVTMMKNEMSKRMRRPDVRNSAGTSGIICRGGGGVIECVCVCVCVCTHAHMAHVHVCMRACAHRPQVVKETIADRGDEALAKSVAEEWVVLISILVINTFMQEGK